MKNKTCWLSAFPVVGSSSRKKVSLATKQVTILVITITGKEDRPKYARLPSRSLTARP